MRKNNNGWLVAISLIIFSLGCSTASNKQAAQSETAQTESEGQVQVLSQAQSNADKPDEFDKLINDWQAFYLVSINDLSEIMDDYENAEYKGALLGTKRLITIEDLSTGGAVHKDGRKIDKLGPQVKKQLLDGRRIAFATVFGSKTKSLDDDSVRSSGFFDSVFEKEGAQLSLSEIRTVQDKRTLAMAKEALSTKKDVRKRLVEYPTWELTTRTIKLSKKECLSCHTTSKIGDPAGVVVFGVKDSPGS